MNIQARNELMETLAEISRIAPFYRLGQLVGILVDMTDHEYTASPISDIEDEELLPAAKEFLESLRRRPPESIQDQIRAHLESERTPVAQPTAS